MVIKLVVIVYFMIISYVTSNPGNTIQDSEEARHLFRLADSNHDYILDPIEFHSVFLDFDINNCQVNLKKTMELVCVGYPLNSKQEGLTLKTDCMRIRIICPSEVTCLPADCRINDLALYKSNKTDIAIIIISSKYDTKITSDEFIQDWLSRSLGTALEAHTLFHHLDVDRSGYISEDPDLPFIIYFFDRDSDGHISQAEFVIQWQKIQNS